MEKNKIIIRSLVSILAISVLGLAPGGKVLAQTGGLNPSQSVSTNPDANGSQGNPTNGSSLNGSGSIGSGSNLSGPGPGFGPSLGGNTFSPLMGMVQYVDLAQSTVRIRDAQGNILDVYVPSGVPIMSGNDRGSLPDLKVGDTVTVTFGSNGQVTRLERGAGTPSTGTPVRNR